MVAGVSAMRCETVALKFDHDSIMIRSQGLQGKYLCTTHLTVRFTSSTESQCTVLHMCMY